MANIKFSAFTQKVALGDVDFLVGYTGADNVRVAPSVFSGVYLPLAGGTMTGDINMDDGAGASPNIKFINGANDEGTIYINSSGKLEIATSGIARQTISSGSTEFSGDIIIPPLKALYLDNGGGTYIYESSDGVIDFYGDTVQLFTCKQNGTQSEVIVNEGSSDVDFRVESNTDTHALFVQASDGYVGIGTTTPTVGLQLGNSVLGETKLAIFNSEGGGEVGLTLQSRTNRAKLRVADNDTSAYVVAEGGISSFGPSASADATNISVVTGDVGIGTTTPIEKLDVDGAIISTASNVTSSTAGTNRAIMDLTSGGARLGHFRGITAAGSGSVKLYSDSVLGITLDASQNTQFEGNIELGNNQQIQLGGLSGGDMKIYFDAADGFIVNKTGDLKILNQGNDKDIYFQTDDGSGGTRTYLYLDGSEAAAGDACWTIWPDNSRIGIGDSKDMQMHHEAGNNYITQRVGDLVISNSANDKDIQFKSDDGAGNITLYYYLDGSIVKNRFPKDVYLEDDVKLLFGDATTPDLEIYHNGSHSWISDQGTGNLNILTSSLNVNNAADTQNMIVATQGGAVSLYTNGVLKFQTSSTGTTTTGQMNIAALNTAPASASAAGTLGEIRYTADYIYVCTATNTWKRTALSTW